MITYLKYLHLFSWHNLFGFLSNFYPATIIDEKGIEWPTSEHLYQTSKYNDIEKQEFIRKQKTPGNTVRKARKLLEYKREDWDEVKTKIMEKCISLKFNQHEDLKRSY